MKTIWAVGLMAGLTAGLGTGCDLPPPEADKKESTAEAAKAAKFAELKLSDFEARAKKAGWKTISSEAAKGDGVTALFELELEDGSHYGYISVIDFTLDAKMKKKAATQVDDTHGIALRTEAEEPDKVDADKILKSILDKAPLKSASRDSLSKALTDLGYKVDETAVDTEDGIATISIAAASKDETVDLDLTLVDYSAAKKDDRVARDGNRFMSAFVCKDCTKRKEKVIAAAWQSAKATALLKKMSNP